MSKKNGKECYALGCNKRKKKQEGGENIRGSGDRDDKVT